MQTQTLDQKEAPQALPASAPDQDQNQKTGTLAPDKPAEEKPRPIPMRVAREVSERARQIDAYDRMVSQISADAIGGPRIESESELRTAVLKAEPDKMQDAAKYLYGLVKFIGGAFIVLCFTCGGILVVCVTWAGIKLVFRL